MKRELTKAEVQAELQRKRESIEQRVGAIEGEAKSTGAAVQERAQAQWARVKAHPLESVGAAGAAGLVLGLLWDWRRRRKHRDRYGLGRSHTALVDDYLDALRDDVRYRVASGEDVGEAVRRSLQDRVPLIVQAGAVDGERKGVLRESFDLFVRTLFTLFVKYAADTLALQYLPDGEARAAAAGNGTVAVTAAASEKN